MTGINVRSIASGDKNVRKYVYDFNTAIAESVLYKYPTYKERTVICCSTQSGCPIGCRFCGAGDAFVRSLTADEIVAQVQYLFADQHIDPAQVQRLQIMFMSMGEPLLNMKNLGLAIARLHALYPRAALLVSTSAPDVDYLPFNKISAEVPTVGLQFSVHESTDRARDLLIPFKKKLTLAQIAERGVAWHRATGRRPFFNYCAHEQNTGAEDVARLRAHFHPAVWNATVSVICERDESIAAANERQRTLAENFMSLLLGEGYDVRCFNPAGQDDIGGGCGQLWFVQDWMRKHPELAKASVGRGKPIVHTPGECQPVGA
jgi:23S rRNA (adenine2503-C2)-methyltransferase